MEETKGFKMASQCVREKKERKQKNRTACSS